MNSHTDDRRTLLEFGNNGKWSLCKVVKTKQDCVLGKHYHKEKVESFMLIDGDGDIRVGSQDFEPMELFREYYIPKNIMHEFKLSKDSILLGLCDKEFDQNDDYR